MHRGGLLAVPGPHIRLQVHQAPDHLDPPRGGRVVHRPRALEVHGVQVKLRLLLFQRRERLGRAPLCLAGVQDGDPTGLQGSAEAEVGLRNSYRSGRSDLYKSNEAVGALKHRNLFR